MSDAFVCDFVRTPIGRYAGALRNVRTDDLAAHPLRVLKQRNVGVDWEATDDIILGCANQAGEDNRNVARMAALLAGYPVSVSATTVNRLCGSGLDAVAMAARAIKSGDASLVIAGGVESMTRAPFVMGKAKEVFSRVVDCFDTTIGWRFINPAMQASYGIDSMPETAENVAEQFQISREDQDRFAYRSQQRVAKAQKDGYFRNELESFPVPTRADPNAIFSEDEHPRADTSLEQLSKLKAPFRAQGGSVTAGNASGINDGAAALLLASEDAIKKYNLRPRARVISCVTTGVEPRIMGVGPLYSTQKLIKQSGISLQDVDLFELNEAFAAQALAVTRGLGFADDAEHVNPRGGAIALGHPLGMSGARLAMTSVSGLEAANAKRAIATMCIGVGQGISMLIEKI